MTRVFGIYQPFPDAVDDITSDAQERYPEESCGFVVDGKYVPKKNKADNPTKGFVIDGRTYVAAKKKGLQAVVHSHTRKQLKHPSEADMQQQIAMNVPWGVLWSDGDGDILGPAWWGDQLETQPFVGRPFIYGIYDCFSLVRDWYRVQHNIIFRDFARKADWWLLGENMYVDHFKECGFFQVSEQDLRPGDAFMSRFARGDTTQHAGIYLGGNQVLHHLISKSSRRDTLSSWAKYVTHWVRHKEQTKTNNWIGLT